MSPICFNSLKEKQFENTFTYLKLVLTKLVTVSYEISNSCNLTGFQ